MSNDPSYADQRMFNDLLPKLLQRPPHMRAGVLYQWVKQNHVSLREFEELIVYSGDHK